MTLMKLGVVHLDIIGVNRIRKHLSKTQLVRDAKLALENHLGCEQSTRMQLLPLAH